MTREELIKALENAAETDRQLDLEIMKIRSDYVLEKRSRDRIEWFYKVGDERSRISSSLYSYGYGAIPRFTSSIDAALTLVPDGANAWGFDFDSADTVGYFSRNHVPDGHFYFEGRHKLPALALCIAALKARVDE